MSILSLYRCFTRLCAPVFERILIKRAKIGKEDPARLDERRGIASSLTRPDGQLFWLHAASVGEAQSALVLINRLLTAYPQSYVLVTSGTVTSATLMGKKLPERAFHQYIPLDHPAWVARFLDFWRPDFAIWMESELWPNLLQGVRERAIPAALVNARMSDRSYKRWKKMRGGIGQLLGAFSIIIAQNELDAVRFSALGAVNVHTSGNLKYSAAPLPYDAAALEVLSTEIGSRPVWVYASTHAGEEALACRVHTVLRAKYPQLLTIVVPRHPERRNEIEAVCVDSGLQIRLRSRGDGIHGASIYIADTLGELGLFYRIAPISLIGRSFSDDGGGGHNPIEAAQLGSAVLSGPDFMYQKELFEEMLAHEAALVLQDEAALVAALDKLLSDADALAKLQRNGAAFVESKARIVDDVETCLYPLINKAFS